MQMPTQIYIVDVFGSGGAASGLAATTVIRYLFAAFLPLAGPPMYDALGLGWGNSVLGFIAAAFIPVPIFFYKVSIPKPGFTRLWLHRHSGTAWTPKTR
jgi:hypothetical protein